jgi:hypothetical protein
MSRRDHRLLFAFTLVSLVFAGVLFACGGGGSGGGNVGGCGPCNSPNECCEIGNNSFCINTTADLQHCGTCGDACDSTKADRCAAGGCACGSGPECGDGRGCCDGVCADTQSDSMNCGGCGLACGQGTTCSGGQCLCEGVACGPGESCCNGTCANTQTDPNNCGVCGTECSGEASACNNGLCGCSGGGGGVCPSGDGVVAQCCEGAGCVDICMDANNCGACGNVCALGACFFGACLPDGQPIEACIPF